MLIPFLLWTSLATTSIASFSEPFDVREVSIASVHDALFSGSSSCREVVSAFISQIRAYNPTVNAIMSLNPKALEDADRLDLLMASGNTTGSLFCIPVLLKDNFDAVGMNTTGGNLALKESRPSVDAPVVAAIRAAGAVILGKASLHDMALEGISVSSLGGQTINPYDHTRTPGGSSGGTGAAIATNFAVWGTGTDTVNSLRSPASANSLFSIRPTFGLISRSGILPNSYTQDSCGPITRNMDDLAIALTVMASVGTDPADNSTSLIPETAGGVDYTSALQNSDLKGLRFGVIEGFFNRAPSAETTPVNETMASTISKLEKAGATIIPINSPVFNSTSIFANHDVQRYEWREMVDSYFQTPNLQGIHPANLHELYDSGNFLILPYQYPIVNQALHSSIDNETYAPTKARIASLTETLRSTFRENDLTALIYPEQQNLVVKVGSQSQHGRNGILAAVTGFPVVTVPIGFSDVTVDAPVGVPIGMEILGLPWSERELIGIGKGIEDLGVVRKMPAFLNGTVEVEGFQEVPEFGGPHRGNIPEAYSVGVL